MERRDEFFYLNYTRNCTYAYNSCMWKWQRVAELEVTSSRAVMTLLLDTAFTLLATRNNNCMAIFIQAESQNFLLYSDYAKAEFLVECV